MACDDVCPMQFMIVGLNEWRPGQAKNCATNSVMVCGVDAVEGMGGARDFGGRTALKRRTTLVVAALERVKELEAELRKRMEREAKRAK